MGSWGPHVVTVPDSRYTVGDGNDAAGQGWPHHRPGNDARRAIPTRPRWIGEPVNTTVEYVQPFATHIEHPERLLLWDATGQCYLWHGDGREMEAIPDPLAQWLCQQPEIMALQTPWLWFDPSSLPLGAAAV